MWKIGLLRNLYKVYIQVTKFFQIADLFPAKLLTFSKSFAARWKHPLGLSLSELLTNEQDSHLLTSNVCICNCTWIHVSCVQARLLFFMFIMLHSHYANHRLLPSLSLYIYIVLLQNLVSFEGTPNRTNPKLLPRKSERPHTASVLFTHMYSSIRSTSVCTYTLNVVLYDSYVSLPCICIFVYFHT